MLNPSCPEVAESSLPVTRMGRKLTHHPDGGCRWRQVLFIREGICRPPRISVCGCTVLPTTAQPGSWRNRRMQENYCSHSLS